MENQRINTLLEILKKHRDCDEYIGLKSASDYSWQDLKPICREIVKFEKLEAYELLRRLSCLIQHAWTIDLAYSDARAFRLDLISLFLLSNIGAPSNELEDLITKVVKFFKDFCDTSLEIPDDLPSYKLAFEALEEAHDRISIDPRFRKIFDDARLQWS